VDEPKRVLVVDDDEVFRRFTASALIASGYATDMAEGGAAAIDKLKQSPPDLMLLDLCMPGVDGWDVLDHVEKMEVRPRVVVVSGMREIVPPGQLSQCITGYVFKPFRAGQLIQTCADVLARPAVIGSSGSRRHARRTFIADASVRSPGGEVLAEGRLVQVSEGGFRLELATEVAAGTPITIAFRVPGHDRPVEIGGVVRWTDTLAVGAEVSPSSGSDEAVLRALVDLR
jgi:CheY-like chemotaxis protein